MNEIKAYECDYCSKYSRSKSHISRDAVAALKKSNRLLRIFKLHALFFAYRHYTQMELKRRLIGAENSWKSAEKTQSLVKYLFPDWETKVTDFIHTKDELTDDVLECWNNYMECGKVANFLGISTENLEAFCKHVVRSGNYWTLNGIEYFHYPMYLDGLYQYANGDITKQDLYKKYFVEYSVFDKKKRPANLMLFRKNIVLVENILEDIRVKQEARKRKISIN